MPSKFSAWNFHFSFKIFAWWIHCSNLHSHRLLIQERHSHDVVNAEDIWSIFKRNRHDCIVHNVMTRTHCQRMVRLGEWPQTFELFLNEAGMIWIFLLKCFLDHTKSSDVHWMISSCLHFRVVRKVDRIPYALTAMPIHLSKGCQTMLDVTRACIQLVPTQWMHLVFQCVMNAIEVFWF